MILSRPIVFSLYFIATFLQAGAYGLTFMLPRLFDSFGANEKYVGIMLTITAISTVTSVYFSGHLADKLGRVATLGWACLSISVSLFLYAKTESVGAILVAASILLGGGWGLTYALGPVVLTRLIDSSERIRYFAFQSIFVMAGFGLSPVLASIVEDRGYTVNAAFMITAALCLLSGILFFILINPIRHIALNAGPEVASRLSLSSIAEILRSRALIPVIMVCLGASVFAGVNNFQTVIADERNLDYATYFFTYTITVILFRILLTRFKGGRSPYLTIASLQYIMCGSILLLYFSGSNTNLYVLVAILFGIGYGASYPVLVAMAANDADEHLVPQTLQLFALTYFVGIFGFPLIAGWLVVEVGTGILLVISAALAAVEATMALKRAVGST